METFLNIWTYLFLFSCFLNKNRHDVQAQSTVNEQFLTDMGYQGSCMMDLQDRDDALEVKVREIKLLIDKVKVLEAKVKQLSTQENRTRECEAKVEQLTPLEERVKECEVKVEQMSTLENRTRECEVKVEQLTPLEEKVKECEVKVEQMSTLENRTRECEAKVEQLAPLEEKVKECEVKVKQLEPLEVRIIDLERQLEQQSSGACTSNPCQNNSTCTPITSYICSCSQGYSGDICQEENRILSMTEYLFAMTSSEYIVADRGPSYIIVWSHKNTTIHVTIGKARATTYTILANTPLRIPISGLHRLIDGEGIEDKGIFVQANNNITLILYNHLVDYILPLPTAYLGTDYLAASYEGDFYKINALSSTLTVVALNDGTTVTATWNGSTVFNTTLNARQTYMYSTWSGDVTGIQVTADKPVSVMSGGDCLRVPVGQENCGSLSSHILPPNRWGQKYVVVTMAPTTCGMLMRVMATIPNTVVSLSDGRTSTLTTAKHWEVDLPSGGGYIVECSHPCMVWLLNKGDCDSTDGAPFQVMVPAIDKWPSVPILVTYASVNVRSLTIMTLTSATYQLTLNGNSLPGWTVITNSIYSWVNVSIVTDDNIIDHLDPTIKVMAFMTEHSLWYAYGTPIGIAP